MTKSMNGLFAAALLVGMTGCYHTTFHTGTTPQGPSPIYDETWHHSVVRGLAEISVPVDLEAACPQGGVAEIVEEETFVNGFVSGALYGLYTPRTIWIRCGAGGVVPAAAPTNAPQ